MIINLYLHVRLNRGNRFNERDWLIYFLIIYFREGFVKMMWLFLNYLILI
jgi:hypothetical protein